MKVIKQQIGMKIGLPIDDLLAAIAKQGEEFIAAGHEHQSQLFLLRRIEGGWGVEVIAITPMPEGQEERDAMAVASGHLVAPFDAYIALCEAYYLKVHSQEEVDAVVGKVKDQPGRVEVFQLHFVTRDHSANRMIDWPIIREEGQRARFGEKNDRSFDNAEGRFVNLYLYSQGGKEN